MYHMSEMDHIREVQTCWNGAHFDVEPFIDVSVAVAHTCTSYAICIKMQLAIHISVD